MSTKWVCVYMLGSTPSCTAMWLIKASNFLWNHFIVRILYLLLISKSYNTSIVDHSLPTVYQLSLRRYLPKVCVDVFTYNGSHWQPWLIICLKVCINCLTNHCDWSQCGKVYPYLQQSVQSHNHHAICLAWINVLVRLRSGF